MVEIKSHKNSPEKYSALWSHGWKFLLKTEISYGADVDVSFQDIHGHFVSNQRMKESIHKLGQPIFFLLKKVLHYVCFKGETILKEVTSHLCFSSTARFKLYLINTF